MMRREITVDLLIQQDMFAWQLRGHLDHCLSGGAIAGVPSDFQVSPLAIVVDDTFDVAVEHRLGPVAAPPLS